MRDRFGQIRYFLPVYKYILCGMMWKPHFPPRCGDVGTALAARVAGKQIGNSIFRLKCF